MTVKEGVSLIGPHCPRTVTMICKVVNLQILRWTYNFNRVIATLFLTSATESDVSWSANTTSGSLEITTNRYDGHTVSILTIDLSWLHRQNVTAITCGSITIADSQFVQVSIIESCCPNITLVTATYNYGLLSSVEATWKSIVMSLIILCYMCLFLYKPILYTGITEPRATSVSKLQSFTQSNRQFTKSLQSCITFKLLSPKHLFGGV